MRKLTRKVLLNTIGASAANLKAADANGVSYLCTDNTLNPIVNLLPGWGAKTVKKVTKTIAVAEVTKVHIIGRVAETISAGTKYGITIGANSKNNETAAQGLKKYGYVAPTPLTTPAATALEQVYTALAAKINADTASNDVTAKVLSKITLEGVAAITSGMVVGEYIWQGATLGTNETWKGRIAFVDPTWSAAVGQVVWVYDEVGTLTTTNSAVFKKGTGSGTAISSAVGAASTRVTGQALAVIDNPGYFPPNPAQRRGETAVFVSAGFISATAEIARTAVYSFGVGADMLKQVPVFAFGTQELVGNADGSGVGDAEFMLNDRPVSGTFYTQLLVEVAGGVAGDVLTGYTNGETFVYEIWLAQTDISTPGANLTNLYNAIVALITA